MSDRELQLLKWVWETRGGKINESQREQGERRREQEKEAKKVPYDEKNWPRYPPYAHL